jgi:hypothetical protein
LEVCLCIFFVAANINLRKVGLSHSLSKSVMEVHRLDISHLASLAVSKLSPHPISIKSIILRAGLTVGRILLLWVNKRVGERRVMFVYTALAIGYDLIRLPSFPLSHLSQP